MSRVKMKNGIGYSKHAIYMDKSAIGKAAAGDAGGDPIQSDQPDRPIEQTANFNILNARPWAFWGDDNLLPNQMADTIETCGILSAIIEGKARFALCEGPVPALVLRNKSGQIEVVDIVNDPEISDFLEANNTFFQCFSWLKDMVGFRNGVARYMLDKEKKKIALFQRDDITEMRYQLMDSKTGLISNIYLSAAWDRVTSSGLSFDQYVKTVPLLDGNNPLMDLKNRVDGGGGFEYALTFRHPGWKKKYYASPLWYAAQKWVSIAQSVPDMKQAMFKNAIRPKWMVLINAGFWQRVLTTKDKSYNQYTLKELEAKKNEFYDQIDENLTGSENAFKAMFSEFTYTPDGKMIQDIEIKPLVDTMPAGEYLPESAVANSEIAFSELFNPSILGSNLPSGPYTNSQGGSNVRESILMQVILHEFERKMLQRFLSIPKFFNGWNVKHQQADAFFEFIIPATIPTTLDTGGSTKPMIPDNSSTSNPDASNGTY